MLQLLEITPIKSISVGSCIPQSHQMKYKFKIIELNSEDKMQLVTYAFPFRAGQGGSRELRLHDQRGSET